MGSLKGGRWPPAVAAAAYVVLAAALLTGLVWTGLGPRPRALLADALADQLPVLVAGGAAAVAGLGWLVAWLVGRYTTSVRHLAAETRLLLDANPEHLVDRSGPPELADLAEAVDALAERRRAAEGEVTAQIAAAQTRLERERNRLATLMAELAAAVVVCNVDGRILLYNSAARSVLADEVAVGIGRSVFGIVDRDLVQHAMTRIRNGAESSHVATTLHRGRVLGVQVAVVPGPGEDLTGFVLLFTDLTERIDTAGRRNDQLRAFTEATRASLGSIRAAIETVLGYPEMDAEDRQRFEGIVQDETRRLGDEVERWATESAGFFTADWPLSDISGSDLASVVAAAVERSHEVTVAVTPADGTLWVKADSSALARAVVHLVGRLHEHLAVEAVTLTVRAVGGYAELEVSWTGAAAGAEEFGTWLGEPLTGGAAPDVRELVARHGGEVWSGGVTGETPHLKLLLPLVEAGPGDVSPPAPTVEARPEFYDFDLFDRRDEARDWRERQLDELDYTVFDTETTGLSPKEGDEIISVGAVRVVNGRLLRQESFERLVDPQRGVPAVSTAVHGLTRDMLRGQPTIDTVLPDFARYAADSVLVGHNVSFDLAFLRLKEDRTGVRFTQPTLDTLLLDAALHPDHEEHSLEAIATRLGIEVVGRHTALGDALVTGEVFLRLITLLRERGARTLGDVIDASRTTMQARVDRRMYDS